MANLKQLLGIVVCIFFVFAGNAEPLNILIGDLTFVRPDSWQWDPPTGNSPALSRFIIPNHGSRFVAEIRFYGAGPEPHAATAMWKSYFPREEADRAKIETKTIGKRPITYVCLTGTLTLPRDKPLADQSFIGVVIPYGDRFIHIRCSGPQSVIDGAITELKVMVESAVREREDDLLP